MLYRIKNSLAIILDSTVKSIPILLAGAASGAAVEVQIVEPEQGGVMPVFLQLIQKRGKESGGISLFPRASHEN